MGNAEQSTKYICPVFQTYLLISSAIPQLVKAKTCPSKLYCAPDLTEFVLSVYKIFLNQPVKKCADWSDICLTVLQYTLLYLRV